MTVPIPSGKPYLTFWQGVAPASARWPAGVLVQTVYAPDHEGL